MYYKVVSLHPAQMSNSEDEFRDIHIDPVSLRLAIQREEPGETYPTLPERELSLRVPRPHPDEPSRRFAPRRRITNPEQSDPPMIHAPTISHHLSAPQTTIPGRLGTRRWDWIWTQLNSWRSEEDGPYYEVGESSRTTPSCPMTEEPTHCTIPLLIARLHRHDTELERLRSEVDEIPEPDCFPQLYQRFQTLQNDHRDLQRNFDNMERRLDSFEETLRSLSSMMNELRESTHHITKRDPSPERRNH